MRFLWMPLLFLSASWMIACQKETNGDPEPELVDTLLTKIIVWDSLLPKENISHVDFVYDGQRRVVKIKRYTIDSVNNTATVYNEDSMVFYYNGGDRKPFKSLGYSRLSGADDLEVFHGYHSDGRLAVDSVGYGDGVSYSRRRYTYSAGYIIGSGEHHFTGYDSQWKDSFALTGNNITQAFFYTPPGSGDTYFEDKYDTKINPLYKLNIASTWLEGENAYDKFIYLSPGYCPNNIIGRKSNESYPLTGNYEVATYQFTYNQKGYPVSGKYTSNYSPDEDTRLRFIYGR